jgi:hypothetical protein
VRLQVLTIGSVLTFLGLAAPAHAAPIAFQFQGLVTNIPTMVGEFVVPELEVGDPFNALITWGEFSEVAASFNLGAYTSSGPAACPVTSCYGPLPVNKPAMTFAFMPGSGTGPPVLPWAPFGGFVHSLFTLTVAEGWQSGSFHIWMENAFIGGGVRGTITAGHVASQAVPEPSSILLALIGVAVAATLSATGFGRRGTASLTRR